jgi:hypothetical protein
MFKRNQTKAGRFLALDFMHKVAALMKSNPVETDVLLQAHAKLPAKDQREIATRLSGAA